MRPLEDISLPILRSWIPRVLQVRAQTSAPIRWLAILIVDASAPNGLFPQYATHLPHLGAPHIVTLMQKYDLVCILPTFFFYHPYGYTRAESRGRSMLLESALLLEALPGLWFLMFMASGVSRYELVGEATVRER